MTLGVLAHCFGKLPVHELAQKVSETGYSYVQLALSKAISDLDCSVGKLSPGLANTIGEIFQKQGVAIPVLGCYVNLVDSDASKVRDNVERFKEHLRFARQFGASIVATETGIPQPGEDREKKWAILHAAIEELLEEAEKWGVFVGLEPANGHLIGSASTMASVVERFPSHHLGVVLDPCNILNQENFYRQDEVIREAFSLLGERVVSLHAKDITPQKDGRLEITAAGTGRLNYPFFMQLANGYKPNVHITMERIAPHEMKQALEFVGKFRS